MNIDSSKIIEIDIDDILPNRFQPRIQFDEDEILELSDSIRKHGIIQPIVVRHIGDKYEIIVGERRYKASVLAGLETIPAIIKELDDKQSAELALIENLQRKSLTPIEEALSYKKVLDLGNLTQEGLAEKIGKSQSSVANKIRLLSLSDEVQDALLDNKISERHARSLLKLKSILDQNSMLDKIINERMTVRKTDEEIEKIIENKKEKSVPDIHKKEGEEKMNNESNENLKVNDFSQLNFGGSAESNQFLSPAPSPVENSFDIFADDMLKEQGTVSSSTVPEPPQMPTFGVELPQAPIAPEQPQMPTFGVELPQAPIAPEQPQMPTFGVELPQASTEPELSPVPETMPIIDNPESGLSSGEYVSPKTEIQPIIITDYAKQFDPIMPSQEIPISKPDWKEVIKLIRDCSSKIEQYGFKIEVEEYDLVNLYQVIFKIDK